ncbi:MAG: hypothetical protein ACK5LX_10360 [Oscillospiraceae bacterium]
MTKSTKRIAVFLAVLLCITGLSLRGSAASLPSSSDYNKDVYNRAQEIYQKFGVDIAYPYRSDGYTAIGVATLDNLNNALDFIGAPVVSEVSNYLKSTFGRRLTFIYTYVPSDLQDSNLMALARFTAEQSTIEIFIPGPNSGMTMSGNSPVAIVHEFGHAFHYYFSSSHGYSRFKQEWIALNGEYTYSMSTTRNPSKYTFVSLYASMDIDEDFADTFAYALTSNRAGLGIAGYFTAPGGAKSNLGKKVDYVENMLSRYTKDPSIALKSIATMRRTPHNLQYEDVQLSGNSLEYINFNEPPGILSNILKLLRIEETNTEWVKAVGGWKVTDVRGGVYLVFPGCGYVTLKIPAKKTA